ncbi:MAG: energy-coupling factor transporter transmembrane protein EcfT [Lachnospiraceae bacterium]|nr:energy-coupling factor transporter transmembrane protein EcfT [Lachnospiraceae bacterium]
MVREITIGQYYYAESVLHRLDPRVKLMGTLIYVIALFILNNILGYVFAAIILAALIKLSKVPFKYIVKGLRAVLIVLLLTISLNLFLTPGIQLVHFWIFTITAEGIKTSVFMALRLIMLIMGCSLMTLTTTPNNLTDGLERSLKFLEVVKVPVHEIAMMMSIALRFIPILLEETDKIMKAQAARGADFESGGIIKRAKAMVPILVPLFVSAFRRANDLAMAMEARCYRGGAGRTKMKPLKYRRADGVSYVLMAFFLAGVILISRFGTLPFEVIA